VRKRSVRKQRESSGRAVREQIERAERASTVREHNVKEHSVGEQRERSEITVRESTV
jgi:hypothetical protein